MPIIDSQMHEPPVAFDWRDCNLAVRRRVLSETATAYLDSVGVSAALLFPLDLGWGEQLARSRPDRFAVVPAFAPGGALKGFSAPGVVSGIDTRVSNFDAVLRTLRQDQWCVGFRLMRPSLVGDWVAGQTMEDVYGFALDVCERNGFPVFVTASGALDETTALARSHPGLTVVVDHLGLPQPPKARDVPPMRDLPAVLALARENNVCLKITGAPTLSQEEYPFRDLWPGLRAIVDAFGPERVIWGSDISRVDGRMGHDVRIPQALSNYQGKHTYGESIHYLRDTDQLSSNEKEWILGRSIQQIVGWPIQRER